MIQKHKQTQTFQSFYQKPAEWTCSASSWTHGVATSIDRQVDPSDETGGVRGEERDALRHLLHLAGPAERVRLLTASQKLQERIDPSVWRFAINPEVVGLTLAYCSSSSPARLWTSVMITPGLKHKRRPIVRKMFLRIHPEASFCTYHTEFTLTCLGASSATEISLVKFSELWGTFTRTPLTQRYAARELVDGRLGHAVRQHTWKLSRRDTVRPYRETRTCAGRRTRTDLWPFTLDTFTMEPLVWIRWGTHSWVRWYTDLEEQQRIMGKQGWDHWCPRDTSKENYRTSAFRTLVCQKNATRTSQKPFYWSQTAHTLVIFSSFMNKSKVL